MMSALGYLGKRSLLDGLAGLLSGGGSTTAAAGTGASNSLTSGLTSALSGLFGGAVDSLAGPAQYLGTGWGEVLHRG